VPELPEVETTLRGVAPHLVGKTITEIDIRERRLRWPVPKVIDGLAGSEFLAARRRGKYLLFEVGGGTIILHLGMSGGLRVLDPEVEWKKHDHLALRLSSGKELRYHDPRRFGCVLFQKGDPESHALLKELGPEPLEDEFSAGYLVDAAKGRKVAIKQLIMNSKIVVGVGNIYACEALYLARINPTREAGKVSRAKLAKLVDAIRSVLGAAIESGGTTLRDFLNEDGQPGYFKQSLHVYGREGEECRGCGGKVKRIVQGQRSTFYCEKCQR
jgi:formamidopyrimidine-DNA glycosylase